MKTYKFSIVFAVLLVIANFFHFRVEKWLLALGTRNSVLYLIYGLFLAFFLVAFLKKFPRIDNQEIGILLLTMGFVFFLLFTRTVFLFQLSVLEMFALGVIVSLEGKKSKSLLPFLIVLITAALVEVSSSLSTGSHFYYLDAWRNGLVALSGYLAGFLLI